MYSMFFCLLFFLYCNLLQIILVEVLLLPFLYIYKCVMFNKCIQISLVVPWIMIVETKQICVISYMHVYHF